MPRFFFQVRDGDGLIEDPDGSELPDLAGALAEALAARDLVPGRIRAGKQPDGRRFEISDAAGRTLATVPFRDAFEPG